MELALTTQAEALLRTSTLGEIARAELQSAAAVSCEARVRWAPDSDEDWAELATSAASTPFCRPEWTLAYLDAFEPNAHLFRFDAYRQRTLIGTLPLLGEYRWFYGVPVRSLRAPGFPKAPDRFDIVCAEADAPAVSTALWKSFQERRDWDVIELVDLPEDGPGWRLMQQAEAAGYLVGRRVSRRTPYISIPADAPDLDMVLAGTSAKFRANLRRRMRNLAKIGPVEVTRTTAFDDGLFSRFLELEHSGWKGRNRTSILSDSRAVRYYRALAQSAAANGYLAMYSLECAGEPLAMHFGLALFGHYLVSKLAFAEHRHEYAPGHLLVGEVVRDCHARGLTEFDFLGDEKPWKMEWTKHVRVQHRVHIFNDTVAGHLAYRARYTLLSGARALSRRLSTRSRSTGSRNAALERNSI